MRKSILISLMVVASVLLISNFSWGQCDPNDRGTCDTVYVEPYTYVNDPYSFPFDVEVALRVTHDVPTPTVDSLQGIVIPLCFTSSNAAANATIDPTKNKCGVGDLLPYPGLDASVFRHLPDMATATEHNWMMDLSAAYAGLEWALRILDLSTGSNFWFSVVHFAATNQGFEDGSKVLLATMTITIADSTTICIDTCFWPPTGRLKLTNADATTFIPMFTDTCFLAGYPPVGVREIHGSDDSRPSEFSLSQNYPNPFNPVTNIEFNLPRAAYVKLDVFNIVGQRVRTLVDEEMEPGRYVADWDGKDEKGNLVSSGIYFYRMDAGDFLDMKKMLLVK